MPENISVQSCGSSTLTIEVSNYNPLAMNDERLVAQNGIASIDVLVNDRDANVDSAGNRDEISLVLCNRKSPRHGTVSKMGDLCIYEPDEGFSGIDSFGYTIEDDRGSGSNCLTCSANVNLEVKNIAPVSENLVFRVNEDETLRLSKADFLGNQGALQLGGVDVSLGTSTGALSSSLTLPGEFTYTPPRNFFGRVQINVTLRFQSTESRFQVTVIVDPVNDPPNANSDRIVTYEDQEGRKNVIANDADFERDLLRLDSIVRQSRNRSARVSGNLIIYTPNPGFSGQDSLTYRLCDNGFPIPECTESRDVLVDVIGNRPPIAGKDIGSTRGGIAVSIRALSNDSDPDGNYVFIQSINQPANGQAVQRIIGNPFSSTTVGIEYTPNAGFVGTDSFTYTIRDIGGKTATATVTVQVSEPNSSPRAGIDRVDITSGATKFISVLANDSDPDGDVISLVRVVPPRVGTASVQGNFVNYTARFGATGVVYFGYFIRDTKGAETRGTIRVNIQSNRAPVAVRDDVFINEDSSIIIRPLDNDSDPDGDFLSLLSFGQPLNGTATRIANRIRFTPNPNFNGATSFNYVVSDGKGGIAQSSINIQIRPVNDGPVAQN